MDSDHLAKPVPSESSTKHRPISTAAQLKKRLDPLRSFLTARGAEVLEPTNEWELLRFRADRITHVVFTNKRGTLSANERTKHIINCFSAGKPWTAGVATPRRHHGTDERALLKRDGDSCFLCRRPLGDDVTIEHLVPVVHGGANHIANKALAHAGCNMRMGHMSVMEKIALRERIASNPTAPADGGE